VTSARRHRARDATSASGRGHGHRGRDDRGVSRGGSVFADFDVDPDGRVFAVRVSFDGYGCCHAPVDVGRMSVRDSEALLAMAQQGSIHAAAAQALRAYFQQDRDAFWSDALTHHGLLSSAAIGRGGVDGRQLVVGGIVTTSTRA
jgi:hypothetical protein